MTTQLEAATAEILRDKITAGEFTDYFTNEEKQLVLQRCKIMINEANTQLLKGILNEMNILSKRIKSAAKKKNYSKVNKLVAEFRQLQQQAAALS